MNYRHIYHAGNFADVVKHLVLISLLKNLVKKDTPYYILDCFAGVGKYDLNSELSLKTNEAQDGIKKLLAASKEVPDLIKEYINIIKHHSNDCQTYPGSPLIISKFLRTNDKADFCELHPEDFKTLKRNLKLCSNISCHNIDAYLSFKSLLPPIHKRGLVLIDPAFEVTDEFEKIIAGVTTIYKKFSQATCMIWYPIKEYKKVSSFYKSLEEMKKEKLKIEFTLDTINSNLKSIGIIVINPPNIMLAMEENLKYLKNVTYNNQASYSIGLF